MTTSFTGKTRASILATLGTTVRDWDDKDGTPMAVVPATDAEGRRFELVFAGPRRALFDAHNRATVEAEGLTVQAEGYWYRRAWKKTRTTGGWGYTWQFVVGAWSVGGILFLGEVPEGMKEPEALDVDGPAGTIPADAA